MLAPDFTLRGDHRLPARSTLIFGALLLLGTLCLLPMTLLSKSAHAQDPGRDRPTEMQHDRELRFRRGLEQQEQRKYLQKRTAAPAGPKALSTSPGNLVTRAGADLEVGGRGGSISIADVDGKNGPDLLITGVDADGNRATTLYLQQADGSFQPADAGLKGVSGESSTSIADVDGRNGPDLLITGRDENFDPTAILYLQQSDGSFQAADAGLDGVALSSTSIADVDGQNGPDLLITGSDASSPSSATLYLQQANGSFQAADAGLNGIARGSASIAEIDGQNGPDLLITGQDENSSSSATLYLQQSDGSFQAADAGLDGVGRSSASIADVDGQNGPDLLITGEDTNFEPSATLYLQQSDGSFQAADAGLDGVDRSSTSIADVDGQNGPDLLITGGDSDRNPTATLYLQQSDGSFQPSGAGLTGILFGSSSIADIDSDGDSDLLITGASLLFLDVAESTRLYVNRTNQAGPNESPRRIKQVKTRNEVAAGTNVQARFEYGDPNGDKLTLRLTQVPSVGTVDFTDGGNGTGEVEFTPDRSQLGQTVGFTVEAADGSGEAVSFSFEVEVPETLAARQTGLTGVKEGSASITDVNSDGNLDLLVTGQDVNGDQTATLYLQQSDDSFQPAGVELEGVEVSSASIADVDGQNGPDLLITGRNANLDLSATLYLQQPDGSFQPAGAGLTGVGGGSTSIADVDGQNGPDLLITGEGANGNPTATLYLQQSDGSFQPANANLIGVRSSSSSIGDVDGKNGPDLLITGRDANFDPTATLYLQQSDGSFQPAGTSLTGVRIGSSSIGDVDGKNGPDLLITGFNANLNPSATLYLQQSDGSFQAANANLVGVFAGSSSALKDVDGDGALDLLIAGEDANFTRSAMLYLQQSDGAFQQINAGLTGVSGSSTATGDTDEDGDPDLLITGSAVELGQFSGRGTATLYENLLDPAEAAAQKVVSGSGTVTFGGTGLAVEFATGTSGEDFARVVKFSQAPSQQPGLPSSQNVSTYRFVVEAGRDLSVGSGTELRFDVSSLRGTPNPSNIQVYRRDPPGTGRFDLVPNSSDFSEITAASYDAASDELVVPTTKFGEFVFVSDSNPLPIELAFFEGSVAEEDGHEVARLQWKTVAESGNSAFEVQRWSTDSDEGWNTVGHREGAGTTSQPQSYRFIDSGLPYEADTLNYRLRQVDVDGTSRTTESISLVRGGPEGVKLIGTAPNPAHSQATVRYAVPRRAESIGGTVTLRLYDSIGRQVRTLQVDTEPGRHKQNVDVSSLPSGVYFLRLDAGPQSRTRKLTVVR